MEKEYSWRNVAKGILRREKFARGKFARARKLSGEERSLDDRAAFRVHQGGHVEHRANDGAATSDHALATHGATVAIEGRDADQTAIAWREIVPSSLRQASVVHEVIGPIAGSL